MTSGLSFLSFVGHAFGVVSNKFVTKSTMIWILFCVIFWKFYTLTFYIPACGPRRVSVWERCEVCVSVLRGRPDLHSIVLSLLFCRGSADCTYAGLFLGPRCFLLIYLSVLLPVTQL